MSQRTFRTRAVDVMAGWDRPLQAFFLTVTAREGTADAEPGDVLYTQLADPDFDGSLSAVREALESVGVELPDAVADQLSVDRQMDAGNETSDFGEYAGPTGQRRS